MTYFPNNVRRRADGCLEKAVWASTEQRLNELVLKMEGSGWLQAGETFKRGRNFVARIVHPGNREIATSRRGWQ